MKRIFAVMAFVVPFAFGMNAQSQEEVAASLDRIAQLIELRNNQPGKTEVAEIDNFVESVSNASDAAIKNSNALGDIRSSVEKGAEFPSLAELQTLFVGITEEGKAVAEAVKASEDAGKKAKEIADEAKNANPMKAIKLATKATAVAKAMENATKSLTLLGTESATQVKIIADMIREAEAKKASE